MRWSEPRLVALRVRLAVGLGAGSASWRAGVCWGFGRRALREALVIVVRETVGGDVEAWGKSKPPPVKEKEAGGGDGDEGGLGIGDVGARSH
ncbi:hypothetical protein PtrV1_01556 [Pyrenophora tritici-repentis]|nr:hypothetical protein PtrV1_01556 [Pyrenophora tritici-repentis]